VIVIGESEMESGALTLKDLTLGEQENLSIQEIITKLAE
jgi:histidyl-tRNA synthetase